MKRKNNRYSSELKETVVKEYLSGELTAVELCEKYKINDKKRIYVWVKKYQSGDVKFTDNRGKKATGRPRKIKPIEEMTQEEYIEHLELENKILKKFAEMLEKEEN